MQTRINDTFLPFIQSLACVRLLEFIEIFEEIQVSECETRDDRGRVGDDLPKIQIRTLKTEANAKVIQREERLGCCWREERRRVARPVEVARLGKERGLHVLGLNWGRREREGRKGVEFTILGFKTWFIVYDHHLLWRPNWPLLFSLFLLHSRCLLPATVFSFVNNLKRRRIVIGALHLFRRQTSLRVTMSASVVRPAIHTTTLIRLYRLVFNFYCRSVQVLPY